MKEKHQGFSLDGFAKYYDLLTPAERSAFRRKQVELSGIGTGEKVLDVGCGTGALSLLAKVAVGATGEAAGIDISPNMISRAREKQLRRDWTSISGLPPSTGCPIPTTTSTR